MSNHARIASTPTATAAYSASGDRLVAGCLGANVPGFAAGIGGEAGKGYRGDQRKECSAESELERFDHVRYSGA